MTLIELVAAIVITGIMATAGAAAFASVIDHRRAIKASTVETERATALRDMLRGWLAQGTVQIQRGGGPQRGGQQTRTTQVAQVRQSNIPSTGITAALAAGDELTITTPAPTPLAGPVTRMRLFVDGDPNTTEEGLTMEYMPPNASQALQRLELDRSIGTFVVEFLDRRTNRWVPSTEAATIQPLAVRVTLGPAEGDTLPRVLTLPFTIRIGDPSQPMVGR
jgi:type II secretory pathway pseudopilin PulG